MASDTYGVHVSSVTLQTSAARAERLDATAVDDSLGGHRWGTRSDNGAAPKTVLVGRVVLRSGDRSGCGWSANRHA
jgi:hypothetical protein